ncbi:MAG: tRNA (adenosine(37)-N6)-threonylcarbamoyltransferase complex transferase subunit TsaD [Opitutae bacterium]|nr:tRNA (adenosine(37)-N6)-threonylcarbamoyltransferase complex transferase subunit TsaD [Opitutae bacterium]
MILALESSCDETAVALFDPAQGFAGEWVHSQIALHEAYGGVVPDLASREHLQHFGPLIQRALALLATRAPAERITKIAVTHGPGLAACLAMGLSAAKSLALNWRVPLVGVNHLRAHAFSPFIALHESAPAMFDAELGKVLPHLGLLVSGGNTALFSIDESRRIRLLASTLDDAAGEALDKGAKLLGLGYPGGPQVEKLAKAGSVKAFEFPKAIAQRATLDFSFSGLKTSLRYQLEKMQPADIEARKADLCASYQHAVMDALVRKTKLALERGFAERGRLTPPSEKAGSAIPPCNGESAERVAYRSVGLSGGVANNQLLQGELEKLALRHGVPFFRARPQHTGDNAGMIAFAAWAEREPGGVKGDGADGVSEAGFDLEIAPSLALG